MAEHTHVDGQKCARSDQVSTDVHKNNEVRAGDGHVDGQRREIINRNGGTGSRVLSNVLGADVTVGSCAKSIGKVKKRVWGVQKNGLYGWKMKMVVVDQQTPNNIHSEKVNIQPNPKLKSKLMPKPSKQIMTVDFKKRTKEDNMVRKEKMTSAENKLLKEDPGTLSQDTNLDVSQSLCSSLEAILQDDRMTTLPSRDEDDQLKMAMKMTSKKTTPTENLIGRGPGLNIYDAELAEKLISKNGPNVKCAAERTNQGKQVQVTPARFSGQNEKVFTKPQQVYSSAVIRKPDEPVCTSPFNQWEECIEIRDGSKWPSGQSEEETGILRKKGLEQPAIARK